MYVKQLQPKNWGTGQPSMIFSADEGNNLSMPLRDSSPKFCSVFKRTVALRINKKQLVINID